MTSVEESGDKSDEMAQIRLLRYALVEGNALEDDEYEIVDVQRL